MKRVKPQTITSLLRQVLREDGLETPLLEYRITHQGWEEVAGSYIAERTEKLTIFNQVLYVQCRSAAVRQEIMLQRSEMVRKLNQYVDSYIISDIVVK